MRLRASNAMLHDDSVLTTNCWGDWGACRLDSAAHLELIKEEVIRCIRNTCEIVTDMLTGSLIL